MNFQSPVVIRGVIFLLALIAFIPFQNCSKVNVSDSAELPSSNIAAVPEPQPMPSHPEIHISADSQTVSEGKKANLTVTYQDLESVSYLCTDRVSNVIVAGGSISRSGQVVQVSVAQDLHCEARGRPVGSQDSIQASLEIGLDCANRIKNTALNRCEDFSCNKIIEISGTQLLDIPERTSDGICYAAKIMSAIANSKSSLTTEIDHDVISRNHDGDSVNHNPYQMGLAQPEIRINGPRVVKLSGGLNANQKILVDNFILMGIYPANKDISQSIASIYQVMGSSDSSMYDSTGKDTHQISFKNVQLPVISFASGGTSSLSAVDVTRSIEPKVIHKMDIRALDCGGARQLSDIYILFQ